MKRVVVIIALALIILGNMVILIYAWFGNYEKSLIDQIISLLMIGTSILVLCNLYKFKKVKNDES